MDRTVRVRQSLTLLATLALLAGCAPAAAQPAAGPVDQLRLSATGQATATLHLGGQAMDITEIINHQHPSGWTGEGVIVIVARGPSASCRISSGGVTLAEDAGPAARCQWP